MSGARTARRKIVLGHKGETIRAIGQPRGEELAGILEQKVHLFLFVKVRENWGDDPERYREMGLGIPAPVAWSLAGAHPRIFSYQKSA